MQSKHLQQIALSLAVTACLSGMAQAQPAAASRKFQIVEATIADIHKAIKSKQLTPRNWSTCIWPGSRPTTELA